eukprot:2509200-Rhodomonas_salina.2
MAGLIKGSSRCFRAQSKGAPHADGGCQPDAHCVLRQRTADRCGEPLMANYRLCNGVVGGGRCQDEHQGGGLLPQGTVPV